MCRSRNSITDAERSRGRQAVAWMLLRSGDRVALHATGPRERMTAEELKRQQVYSRAAAGNVPRHNEAAVTWLQLHVEYQDTLPVSPGPTMGRP